MFLSSELAFLQKKCYTIGEMQLFDLQPYRSRAVCVALSGGVDSVCLLHYFKENAQALNITLSAVHIEHGIRGEESLRDMRFCQALCKSWEIPLHVISVNVPGFARKQKIGIEEAGRKLRYEQFFALLERGEVDFVATAHHQNDVAETILFRLARGTSLAGMRAIAERKGIVRPLLPFTREQIEEYVAQNKLDFVEDGTNMDEKYARNAIRHTVMPVLEEISSHAAEHISHFAALAAEDDKYLNALATKEVSYHQDEALVPADLPDPLFYRACLAAMNYVGVQKDYTGAHFEALSQLRARESGKKINLPSGVQAAREYDKIVFYRAEEENLEEKPFAAEYGEWLGKEQTGLRVDMDAFPKNCVLRTRRERDFIVPFGGRKKTLKKFLTDKKISARAGRKLKLIACGSEVLAVLGVEISDKLKVTENTTRVGFLK